MPDNVSDEVFAKYVTQIGNATLDQVDAAKILQAELAKTGAVVPLAEVLVKQGILTPAIRENIEKKLQVIQQGGLRQLGPYKLIRKIGAGSMGEVYLAEDTVLGRKVALKILSKKFSGNREFITRFRGEARATGKLNHENIVGALTVNEEMGFNYFVMEYCDGDTLSGILKQRPTIAWNKAVAVVMQVACGLQHAHAHGIVHRDIKPANIIVCKPPRRAGTDEGDILAEGFVAKILDLGLSRVAAAGDQLLVNQTGSVVGTPQYMSPEQARGDQAVDGRTDIYSLGATFYRMLTGDTPFHGPTAATIMMKHLSEQLPNPQDICPDIPDGVVRVLQKMMAKDPRDRYRDCKELLDDLELVSAGKQPVGQVGETGKSSVAARMKVPPLRRPSAPGGPAPPKPAAHSQAAPTSRESRSGAKSPSSFGLLAGLGGGVLLLAAVLWLTIGGLGGKPDKSDIRNAQSDRTGRPDAPKREPVGTPRDAHTESAAGTAGVSPAIVGTPRDAHTESAEEIRAKAANSDAEKLKLDATRRKAEEERKAGEARRLAAEQSLKKASETAPPPPGPTEQPAVKAPGPETPAALTSAAAARAAKAEQLLGLLREELAPLLKQNKFAEALAVLEQKTKDPAAADAAELLKQETLDVEAVAELRRQAVEVLRKMTGQIVSLKMGRGVTTGKILDDPQAAGVKLDLGGATMVIPVERLHIDDVDKYAPEAVAPAERCEGLRRRGLLFLYAGSVPKAEEFFGRFSEAYEALEPKPKIPKPESYLKRIAALEMGEVEAAALKAWESAEKLFAAKNMPGAKAAYNAFEREHGKTQVALNRAATLKERYDAIEKVLGPSPALTLDLGAGVKLELVLIHPGKFMLGSPAGEMNRADGETPHPVTLTQSFYMGKYPVTQEQYEALMGNNPSMIKGAQNPVEFVSWNDAQEFCARLSKKTERTVRLPTEAEWEYACRAGTTTAYYFGDSDAALSEYCWYKDNSEDKPAAAGDKKGFANKMPHPVGGKKPNAWGLYDMHGNVCQWCQDWFDKLTEQAAVDPPGPAFGKGHVMRGGSCSLSSGDCRSAFRIGYPAERISGHVGGFGFRVVVRN